MLKKLLKSILVPTEVVVEEARKLEVLYCQNPNCKDSLIEEGSKVLIANYSFYHPTGECREFAVGNKNEREPGSYENAQLVLKCVPVTKFNHNKIN